MLEFCRSSTRRFPVYARDFAGSRHLDGSAVGDRRFARCNAVNRFTRHVKPRARHVPGEMNKTETAYAELLEGRKLAGEILGWRFEAYKLRQADRAFRSPFARNTIESNPAPITTAWPRRSLERRHAAGCVASVGVSGRNTKSLSPFSDLYPALYPISFEIPPAVDVALRSLFRDRLIGVR